MLTSALSSYKALKKDRPDVEVWYTQPYRVEDARKLALKGCNER